MREVWKKRSLSAKQVERILWLYRGKRTFEEKTDEDFNNMMSDLSEKSDKPCDCPDRLIRRKVETEYIDTMQTFVWGKERQGGVILYLHGGAYAFQPTISHYHAVEAIASAADCRVYFPIYPKIPKYTFKDCYPLLDRLYSKILEENPDSDITIMGDSAGGGLALGFSMWLRDFNLPLPKNIILLSPWLDVTMSGKNLNKYEKRDPMLSAWGLKKMGFLWADSDPDSTILPYVSPMYGDFSGLPGITLFIGTHDILFPQSVRFSRIMEQRGKSYDAYIGNKLNHVFAVYPIPEARRTQKIISEIIRPETQ